MLCPFTWIEFLTGALTWLKAIRNPLPVQDNCIQFSNMCSATNKSCLFCGFSFWDIMCTFGPNNFAGTVHPCPEPLKILRLEVVYSCCRCDPTSTTGVLGKKPLSPAAAQKVRMELYAQDCKTGKKRLTWVELTRDWKLEFFSFFYYKSYTGCWEDFQRLNRYSTVLR